MRFLFIIQQPAGVEYVHSEHGYHDGCPVQPVEIALGADNRSYPPIDELKNTIGISLEGNEKVGNTSIVRYIDRIISNVVMNTITAIWILTRLVNLGLAFSSLSSTFSSDNLARSGERTRNWRTGFPFQAL